VKTFVSRCHFDAFLFSEPLAIMNALWEYGQTPTSKKVKWCTKHGIFLPRMKTLDGTCKNLQQRVADFFDIPNHRLEVLVPPTQMPHSVITILRVIQFWVFHDTLIQFDPSRIVKGHARNDEYVLKIGGNSSLVKTKNLEQVFKDSQRHPFTLSGEVSVQQNGSFSVLFEQDDPELDFLAEFQVRLLSFSTEYKYVLVNAEFNDCFITYVNKNSKADLFEAILSNGQNCNEFLFFKARPQPAGKALRGRSERPCGLWIVTAMIGSSIAESVPGEENEVLWCGILFKKTKSGKAPLKTYVSECNAFLRTSACSQRRLAFSFSCGSIIDRRKASCVNFNLSVFGEEKGVSELDMKDLFASTTIKSNLKKTPPAQTLIFPTVAIEPPSNNQSQKDLGKICCRYRPIIHCIPEAARLASVLASSQRTEHFIKLLPSNIQNEILSDDTSAPLLVYLDKQQTSIRHRWKRFGTTIQVYIEPNSVPGSAVPMHEAETLYCVCANTLELKGGAIKAEGLTLLPSGKLFLQLCRLTFGLYKQENVDNGTYISKTILLVDPDNTKMSEKKLQKRIKRAVNFHKSAIALGEKLKCFPDKVEELLKIFDGVLGDPYDLIPWKSLASNPFIANIHDI
jgi:hypothetical protein